ncbi:FBD-associated F-box protein At1g66310-like [Oryza brachyantha]|uniref:FBD-associated F-box protein At1g66310-like n=1 Tax=Oryza brachyantha TaxID=4533 RepID=UPI0003EA9359|nr:FBD-associated F-box protein At1g66310-like [Oryza brachyantha]
MINLSAPQRWRWQPSVRAGGLSTLQVERKVATNQKEFPLQQDNWSQCDKRTRLEIPSLPEDLLPMILSHMPMRDAARAACVSRAFLRSWRYYPNLIFNSETIVPNQKDVNGNKTIVDFITIVDNIMRNHSGIGVKSFKLELGPGYAVHPSHLDRWLKVASTIKIKEFACELPVGSKAEYNFPYSLLFTDNRTPRNSVQSFSLSSCAFHPTLQFDCLTSLRSVRLSWVHITGEELACFLSNSFNLETLEISCCCKICFLKTPTVLQQLNCLQVQKCYGLNMIEINAPKLSSFHYRGPWIEISLGDSVQLKDVNLLSYSWRHMLNYVHTKLPTIARNVENLFVMTRDEDVHTPMVPNKFHYLKYLELVFIGARKKSTPCYDFFSLVSFLDASPALETFVLHLDSVGTSDDCIFGDSSELRELPKCNYNNLKNVKITGVVSSKTLVELICHILNNTPLLECLTLDTRIYGFKHEIERCPTLDPGMMKEGQIECEFDRELLMSESDYMEACRARHVIRRYIERKVPSTVNFEVVEPSWKRAVLGKRVTVGTQKIMYIRKSRQD